MFVVYECDKSFDEYLEHFGELLLKAGINCDMDQYHANDDITNWNVWCERQIKKARYILFVCSPQLRDKLDSHFVSRVDMKSGFINSSTLRPLLDEGISSNCVIPIVPHIYKPQDCILTSLSTRSHYVIPFDELMKYETVEEVLGLPDFNDFVSLLARLTGQNLVPKPPVALKPPKLLSKLTSKSHFML